MDPAHVVATNIERFENARVVMLLGSHKLSKEYAADCTYIESVVSQLAARGHFRILAEDHWKKPRGQVQASHIPNLCKTNFIIDGWDDPDVLKELHETNELFEKAYVAALPDEKIAVEEKQFAWIEAFTINTFDRRQESLISRLFCTLQEGKGRETIVVLLGPEHVLCKEARLKASCEKLMQILEQVPFVILQK